MKNLFLLMALILTFAEFNAVAHGAQNVPAAAAMATQLTG
jgi:hypothetical protein